MPSLPPAQGEVVSYPGGAEDLLHERCHGLNVGFPVKPILHAVYQKKMTRGHQSPDFRPVTPVAQARDLSLIHI